MPLGRYLAPLRCHRSKGSSETSLSQDEPEAQSDIDLGRLTGKNGFMVEYEIKTDDRRLVLEGFDAVLAAVRSGQIGRAAQIREKGEESWTPIASDRKSGRLTGGQTFALPM